MAEMTGFEGDPVTLMVIFGRGGVADGTDDSSGMGHLTGCDEGPAVRAGRGVIIGGGASEIGEITVGKISLARKQRGIPHDITFFSARPTIHKHELESSIALKEVTNLLEDLLVVLLLIKLQVCRIALQTPSHVVRQVLECESGLLFSGSKICDGIGRECFEARVGEWCKSEKWESRIFGVDDGTVLQEHHTKPLKEV